VSISSLFIERPVATSLRGIASSRLLGAPPIAPPFDGPGSALRRWRGAGRLASAVRAPG